MCLGSTALNQNDGRPNNACYTNFYKPYIFESDLMCLGSISLSIKMIAD